MTREIVGPCARGISGDPDLLLDIGAHGEGMPDAELDPAARSTSQSPSPGCSTRGPTGTVPDAAIADEVTAARAAAAGPDARAARQHALAVAGDNERLNS